MKSTLVALVVSACLVASVACQAPAENKPNELKFNGNSGDQNQPATPTQDTTIIDDNKNQGNQRRPADNGRPSGNSDTQLEPYDSDGNNNNNRQRVDDLFQNFGFGGADDFGGPLIRPHSGSLWSHLLGGNLFDSLRRQEQTFNRQFDRLRKQAGEGQEVSYFNRNGVAYVRTCTTKRVDGGGNDNGDSANKISNRQQIA